MQPHLPINPRCSPLWSAGSLAHSVRPTKAVSRCLPVVVARHLGLTQASRDALHAVSIEATSAATPPPRRWGIARDREYGSRSRGRRPRVGHAPCACSIAIAEESPRAWSDRDRQRCAIWCGSWAQPSGGPQHNIGTSRRFRRSACRDPVGARFDSGANRRRGVRERPTLMRLLNRVHLVRLESFSWLALSQAPDA
jgi:hypothetical protein